MKEHFQKAASRVTRIRFSAYSGLFVFCVFFLLVALPFIIAHNKSLDTINGNPRVYYTKQGNCYHLNPDCSLMVDPSSGTRYAAANSGYSPCSKCYKASDLVPWYVYFIAFGAGFIAGHVAHPILLGKNEGIVSRASRVLQSDTEFLYCRYCGKKINIDSVFCRHCGKQQ